MINVTATGRLGKDPETRHTKTGKSVTNFSLAITDRKADKNAPTLWLQVTAWEKLGEIVEKYLSKGREVLVSGRLQIREYEANRGEKKTSVEIVADTVEFFGTGERDGSDAGKDRAKDSPRSSRHQEVEDEDIPF